MRITDMEQQTVEIAIEGMTCDHCAVTIQHALAEVPGVERADVSFPEKRAEILTKSAVAGALVRAVENGRERWIPTVSRRAAEVLGDVSTPRSPGLLPATNPTCRAR